MVEIKHEIAVILGLSFALILIVYVWPESALRIPFGVFYSLFSPGYSLVAALFPKRKDLDGIKRVTLSLGFSVVVVSLIGLLLNYTPWGIRLDPVLISVTSFVVLCSGIAYYRRGRLPVDERFVVRFEFDLQRWQRASWLDKTLSIMLVLSIVAALGALVYAIARPRVAERFTEFYILGPNGVASEYPSRVSAGEPITLIVGIVNHEHADVHYRVERESDDGAKQIAYLQLGHEEVWEQAYTFNLTEPGEHKVAFLLYRDGDVEPYRSLHVWITVEESALSHD